MSKLNTTVTKVYKPEILKCPYCGAKMKFLFVGSNKIVQFYSGKTTRIKNMYYGCQACGHEDSYPSLTATKLAFRGYTYSAKTICMIDHFKSLGYSREKISLLYEGRNIIVSDRNVDILHKKFLEYCGEDKKEVIINEIEKMNEKYNEARLSIDSICTPSGYYILFYNFFTGDLLAIFKFENLEDEKLVTLLNEVLAEKYNIKIIATVGVRAKFRGLLKQIVGTRTRLVSYVKF